MGELRLQLLEPAAPCDERRLRGGALLGDLGDAVAEQVLLECERRELALERRVLESGVVELLAGASRGRGDLRELLVGGDARLAHRLGVAPSSESWP